MTTIKSVCVYGDIYPMKYMGKTVNTFAILAAELHVVSLLFIAVLDPHSF